MRCASQDCVVGTQKKDTEVTLNGLEVVRTSKYADDNIKHDSKSAMSFVTCGEYPLCQLDQACQLFSC